jgi:hypothetical protein
MMVSKPIKKEATMTEFSISEDFPRSEIDFDARFSNPVKILRGYKDTVIIGEGLSEGDLIVNSPLSSPVDGQMVRLKPNGS